MKSCLNPLAGSSLSLRSVWNESILLQQLLLVKLEFAWHSGCSVGESGSFRFISGILCGGSERCTLTATSGNRENEFCWGSMAAPHRIRCLPEPLQAPQQPKPPRLANPRAPKNIRRIPPKNHQSGPELDDVARERGTPKQTPHTATMSCRQWLSSAARQCQSALSQQQQPRSFSTSAAVAIRQSNTPIPSRCSSSLSD